MLRASELQHHLAGAMPTILVCLDSLYADVIMPVRVSLPVRVVITPHPWDICCDQPAPGFLAKLWGDRRTFSDTLDWITLREEQAGVDFDVHADDVALLTYTSGTTGRAEIVSELPKIASGKILRRELRTTEAS